VLGFFGIICFLVPVHIAYNIFGKQRFRMSLVFHRLLLKILGFRVRAHGVMASTSPVLFVANHSSYLDIPVLGALIPAAFVAKSEVASWPLFGWLAKLQHTVFVKRHPRHAGEQRDQIKERLAGGDSLILFPEGTSTDGLRVLPFKSSLFSVTEKLPDGQPIMIQPVSVACTELDGMPLLRDWRHFYAWYGDMTFLGHLWDVFAFGRYTVDVVFHQPVDPGSFADRKALAAYCQEQVARGIERCLAGRGITEEAFGIRHSASGDQAGDPLIPNAKCQMPDAKQKA